MSHKHRNENWNSNLGVVLAVAGSAVGFGNFLRFPGLAAQYGGGAFMIAYLCAFLLLGIPLSWVEWAVGRRGGTLKAHSTPAIFHRISGHGIWKYMGIMGVIAPLAIAMYYISLEGWTLGYMWHTMVGDLNLSSSDEFGSFFANYVGLAGGDGSVFNNNTSTLVFFTLTILANFYVIYRGISKGIETFCKWSMPVLLITAIIILVRVLTMGTPDATHPNRNVNEGLGYMWNPNKVVLVADGKTLDMVPASATPQQKEALIAEVQAANPGKKVEAQEISLIQGLLNPEMWIAAAGQVFFSLSVGFGTVCTYASYVRRRKDIALSAFSANITNAVTEVGIAGMMIIPAAVAFLGVIAAAGAGTFGLGFNVLPQVFASMPGGQIFGTLFFGLLFVAAITSAISMLQPAVAFLEEYWHLKRVQSVTLVALIMTVGALIVAWFTNGLMALDTLDFWIGTMSLYITTGLYLYLFRFVWGTKNGINELMIGSQMPLPRRLLGFITAWVTPAILVFIFGSWLYQNIFVKVGTPISNLIELERGAVFPIVWVILSALFFAFVIHTSDTGRKKRKHHLDENHFINND